VRGVAVVRLSVEERVEVLQLYKQGLAIHQIAKEMRSVLVGSEGGVGSDGRH